MEPMKPYSLHHNLISQSLYTLVAILVFLSPINIFSQGTPDPPESIFTIESEQNAVLKLTPQYFNPSDTSAIKFTNMNSGGTGTEFLVESVGERGLHFKTFSDLSGNTTDSILILKPNGDIYFGTHKGIGVRNLGVTSTGMLTELDIPESPWNTSGSNIYYSAGRVGIGTSVPTVGYLLDVNGWSKTDLLRVNGNTDGFAWKVGVSGNFLLRDGDTALGVEANDLVGLGAIPVNDIDLTHRGSSGTSDDSGVYIKNPIANNFKMWVSNASGRLEFYSNDNLRAYVNASNGNWTLWSDRRLKKDITSLGSGHLDKIMQMEPVSYQMINQSSDRVTFGLIAQDVMKLYPEIVEAPERDDCNSYSLSYTELIPVLIAGIQEQQEEIENLKSDKLKASGELEQLKAELIELRKMVNDIIENGSK